MTLNHLDITHEDRDYINNRREAPPKDSISRSVRDKAQELERDTEYDTMVSVYQWVTENIAYDLGDDPVNRAEKVLQERETICAGYANLTQHLLAYLGIEVYYISGNVLTGASSGVAGHGWNEVVIVGGTYALDTTWGSRYSSGGEFRRAPTQDYLTDPESLELYHWCDWTKDQEVSRR